MRLTRQLLAVKTVRHLEADLAEDLGLRRVLGPVSLTALGVGAIIGAGIFVLTGLAAREYAGPALMISFFVAGVGCVFAGLCYAEFASMIPVAGSAYTYSYATLGELAASLDALPRLAQLGPARHLVGVRPIPQQTGGGGGGGCFGRFPTVTASPA